VAMDRDLTCADCGQQFAFTASEQDFYKERDFSEPRRCPACRQIPTRARHHVGKRRRTPLPAQRLVARGPDPGLRTLSGRDARPDQCVLEARGVATCGIGNRLRGTVRFDTHGCHLTP